MMQFEETKLEGAYKVFLERLEDERGYFARAWCKKEFEDVGLNANVVQANVSYNQNAGTLRGLHYQTDSFEECKFVRCVRGAIYDVIVDLRRESPTFGQWIAEELTSKNQCMLYVPEGFAHGFQTLQDRTEVNYLVTEFYTPEAECGARYDDPAFGIEWPIPISTISRKDAAWPLFR